MEALTTKNTAKDGARLRVQKARMRVRERMIPNWQGYLLYIVTFIVKARLKQAFRSF